MVYDKLMHLPLGYFSQQKKGDIIARMSGDVGEIENSITSSLDMLIKNPILIIIYFATLIFISWELTLFTIAVVPLMAWGMSAIGKKLKRQSLEAQQKWSETMSQLLYITRILKDKLGDKWSEHVIATTDEVKGNLIKIAKADGLETFYVPDGVGGRFSELCPVGLIAAAVCGIDIEELLAGAAYMDELC